MWSREQEEELANLYDQYQDEDGMFSACIGLPNFDGTFTFYMAGIVSSQVFTNFQSLLDV